MENIGKYNTEKIIMSGIATAVGLILTLLKFYPHIGLILLSFGIVMISMTFTVIAGQYYYEKISKKIGF